MLDRCIVRIARQMRHGFFYTTNLAAAMATVTVLAIHGLRYKKPDVSMTLNGSLWTEVTITAGCDAVTPVGAALIGVIMSCGCIWY